LVTRREIARSSIHPETKHQSSNVTLSKNTVATPLVYVATNPNAYYIKTGIGALATGSRNTMPANPINNFDLTAIKRITFADHYSFEFQAQAFNVLQSCAIHARRRRQRRYHRSHWVWPGGLCDCERRLAIRQCLRYAFSSHPRNLQLVAKFTF